MPAVGADRCGLSGFEVLLKPFGSFFFTFSARLTDLSPDVACVKGIKGLDFGCQVQ